MWLRGERWSSCGGDNVVGVYIPQQIPRPSHWLAQEENTYLADDRTLSWLMELRADERAEPVLLAVGEGGGGRPA